MAIFQTFLFMFIECSTFFSSLLYFLLIPTNIKFEPHEKTIWINLLICDGFFSLVHLLALSFCFRSTQSKQFFCFLNRFIRCERSARTGRKRKKLKKFIETHRMRASQSFCSQFVRSWCLSNSVLVSHANQHARSIYIQLTESASFLSQLVFRNSLCCAFQCDLRKCVEVSVEWME